MSATTITRPTLTDGTAPDYSDGDAVNAAFFGTNVYDKIDALFTTASMAMESSQASGLAFRIFNTANSGSSYARLAIDVGGTSALDPYVLFGVSGGSNWSIGIDNSDSDALKIGPNIGLGSGDALTISTGKNLVPGTAALATNATDGFVYIQSCAGNPSGTPTSYTGRCAVVVDSSTPRLYVNIAGTWRYVGLT